MFERYFSPRMSLLDTETAFKVMARAKALEKQGRSIIHMEIGQPDFDTPANIIEAAYRAMKTGYTGYTPAPGLPEARRAVADYVRRQKGVDASADGVVITPGGKPIIFYVIQMLVGPGDEVVYPNPSFPVYESCIKFSGGTPVPIPLTSANGFVPDVGLLRERVNEKTKLIILNNPGNPTGGVIPEADIAAIADIVKAHPGVFVLSDEIYDRIVYDGRVASIAADPGIKDRVVILDGLSKTYAMTGWRLGFGVMHPELAEQMELLMVNSVSCAAAFTQIATIEALQGPQGASAEMLAAFMERRDYLVAGLNAIDGISCASPGGAFYAFPDISRFGLGSDDFADRLLTEAGVAAASGAAFGIYGEGHIRFSYAASLDNIKIAVERVASFVKKL